MAKNRLVVNHIKDSIQLSWQRGQDMPMFAPPVPFEHPFEQKALEDLRWYLEQYLRFPYGIEPDKAAKIEQQFQIWGQQLFELVFRSSEEARGYFQEATTKGLSHCELSIASDNPVVLNLPWELLYSPLDRIFLAPSLAGMYRSLSNFAVRVQMPAMPQDKLNILLVIARPYGDKDIGFQTIARPLLEALEPIRTKVALKVLRPPSFEEFERELDAHKGFYHIVHFDGHGVFDPNSVGFQHSFGGQGQGLLVFEKSDGSPQHVTAAQIAQNLNDCRVPIFVLNACKSAQEGNGSYSSVATRLVAQGGKGVVAMAYSIYAFGAKHFIGRLYEQLVRGNSLSNAVAAGRREMLNKPERLPKPNGGELRLQDWLVPVLYQQASYAPFSQVGNRQPIEGKGAPNIKELLKQPKDSYLLVDLPESGAYGFVGRGYDILRLERAFRQNNIVLLEGMGGVGKTELVCGFARWLYETQGRSRIFFTSFAQGAGLIKVINQIGRAVWGEDRFSQYSTEEQRTVVLNYLKHDTPCLLIWDNFEPAAGFPDGNESLLSEAERDNLKSFLRGLRRGKSWVLITSRREEPWLECGYTLLNLQGLPDFDAQELAVKILRSAGVDRSQLSEEHLKEYPQLLQLLQGHPLSMRVVLPTLRYQSSTQVIDSLRQGTAQELDPLTISLDYSFTNLSERTRRHLPFFGLFSDRVTIEMLVGFSKTPNHEQAYQAVFGESLQTIDDWRIVLNEAAAAGILERQGQNIYKIHPALPWYLRQRLSERYPAKEVRELEKKLLILYALLADRSNKELHGEYFEKAAQIILLEEPNFLLNLRLAEQQQDWECAQAILQALGKVYKIRGRLPEFKLLRQRALKQIGMGLTKEKDSSEEASAFWVYLRGADANEELHNGDLETASEVYQEIRDELTAFNNPSINRKIAELYHNLGCIAQEKRQFEEAKVHYKQALQISQDAEDDGKAAATYHHLGIVAQEEDQLEEAKAYYQQALQIFERVKDKHSAAGQYHELGAIAHRQGQLEEAKAYYQQALQIYKNAGDDYNIASEYHHLGGVAQAQGQLEEAKVFYKKALKICEDANNHPKVALVCAQLGTVAQQQGDWEDATLYFQKAFDNFEHCKDWYKVCLTLKNWGKVSEEQKDWVEALKIYIDYSYFWSLRTKHEDNESTNEDLMVNTFNLGRMLKVLGESQFQAIWRQHTGMECPEVLRKPIWFTRDTLEKKQNQMNSIEPQLTTTEINEKCQLLQDYSPAQEALALLKENNGRLDISFDLLWEEKHGRQDYGPGESLWQVTLRVLRQEVCGDEGFRSKIYDYNKNPGTAPLLTGAIVYLVGLTTLPINPAIATIIVLYIVKVGLNIFCEYTEPAD